MTTFQPKSLLSISSKYIVKNYSVYKNKLHNLPTDLYTSINLKWFEKIREKCVGYNYITSDNMIRINYYLNSALFAIHFISKKYNFQNNKNYKLSDILRYYKYFIKSNSIHIIIPQDSNGVIEPDELIYTDIKNTIKKSPFFEWNSIEFADFSSNTKKDSVYI